MERRRQTALKRYLKREGVGVGDLAATVGLNRAYFSLIVNGRVNRRVMAKWAGPIGAALGMPAEWVLRSCQPPGTREAGDAISG